MSACRGVVQSAEHGAHNLDVAGSSPAPATISPGHPGHAIHPHNEEGLSAGASDQGSVVPPATPDYRPLTGAIAHAGDPRQAAEGTGDRPAYVSWQCGTCIHDNLNDGFECGQCGAPGPVAVSAAAEAIEDGLAEAIVALERAAWSRSRARTREAWAVITRLIGAERPRAFPGDRT